MRCPFANVDGRLRYRRRSDSLGGSTYFRSYSTCCGFPRARIRRRAQFGELPVRYRKNNAVVVSGLRRADRFDAVFVPALRPRSTHGS